MMPRRLTDEDETVEMMKTLVSCINIWVQYYLVNNDCLSSGLIYLCTNAVCAHTKHSHVSDEGCLTNNATKKP